MQLFDLLKLDLLDPEFLKNPYPIYHRLMKEEPAFWLENSQTNGSWVVSRYDDIITCLRDERFSSGKGRGSRTLNALPTDMRSRFTKVIELLESWVLMLDRPNHTRIKNLLVTKGLKARYMEYLRPRIRAMVTELIDDMAQHDSVDFMEAFAYPLPCRVIAELLGVPRRDLPLIIQWTDHISVLIGLAHIDPDIALKIEAGFLEMTAYFENLIEKYRAQPAENFLSHLIQAQAEGAEISDREMYAQATVLMVGGMETTKFLIGNGLYLLFQHPEQLAMLQANPNLIPGAVEEFLRFESPIQIFGRVALEDIPFQGKLIKEGSHCLMACGAANRDPRVFEQPDTFDVTRKNNKHLAFGNGPHFCAGGPLARAEAQIAFEELLRRLPRLRMPDQEIQWKASPVFRGLNSLMVEY